MFSPSSTAPSANLAPVFNYPVPTLTLGGELDGLTRVTRIAESFYQCEKQQIGIQQFPVIVLPGVSHFQVRALHSNHGFGMEISLTNV